MPHVTVILVARNGARYLPATVEALFAQTRRPDAIIAVDAGSSDHSVDLLRSLLKTDAVAHTGRRTLAQTVSASLPSVAPAEADHWYWILGADNAPQPDALAQLLAAVEVSPSVAVAGPKLMRWDDAEAIAGFGEATTSSGRSVRLVVNELDQSQHDDNPDVMGVDLAGSLVSAEHWHRVGGVSAGLPSVDAGLDLGVRTWLSGRRVARVADARVASAGPAELFGRRSMSSRHRARLHRSAQVHRRMVAAPTLLLPLIWLSLLPVGIGRAVGQLLAKRPSIALAEIQAALMAIFDPAVLSDRRRLRASKQLGWGTLAPLRTTRRAAVESDDRERGGVDRRAEQLVDIEPDRAKFFGDGGAWVLLITAAIGVALFGRFLAAPALTGGGLMPVATTVADLWSQVGVGWRYLGDGIVTAADPFATLFATLGTILWWDPGSIVAWVWVLAVPAAGLGAWFVARRLTRSPWAIALGAVAWAVAPPLIGALAAGSLAGVIVHVLLPVLALGIFDAARSWSKAALAALAFAGIVAAAPVLAPALIIAVIATIAVQPTAWARLLAVPVPAIALAAPLVAERLFSGRVASLLADPLLPVLGPTMSGSRPQGIELLSGSPWGDFGGWGLFAAQFGVDPVWGAVALGVLLLPLGVLAIIAVTLRGGLAVVPAFALAVLGLVTAIAAVSLPIQYVGGVTVTPWPGSGLSLYFAGVVGAAVWGAGRLRRTGSPLSVLSTLAIVATAIPLVVAATGPAAVVTAASSDRVLPAIVVAESVSDPTLGTLRLAVTPTGTVDASIELGAGETLEQWSTARSTYDGPTAPLEEVADLAAQVIGSSEPEVAQQLAEAGVTFVLLSDANAASDTYRRALESLAANAGLQAVGEGDVGALWRLVDASEVVPVIPGPLPWQTGIGIAVLIGQALVFAFFLLLAIPTRSRHRVRAAKGALAGAAATDSGAPDHEADPAPAAEPDKENRDV